MSPFHAMYFLKNNLRRMAVVLVMLGLTALLYVGGSYLSNIEVECRAVSAQMDNWTFLYDRGDDVDGSELERFLTDMENSKEYRVMAVGSNQFLYPTTLGFQNGDSAVSFTEEDFRWLNKREKLLSDESRIADNTLILSPREAEYLGISDGELFTENREEAMFYYGEKPYKVVVSDTLDNFFACLIANDSAQNTFYLLTYGDASDAEQFQESMPVLKKEYPNLFFSSRADRELNIRNAFAINNVIFISIIAVVTCVFFITVNAVLVGVYEKRRNEFILYHSIGISQKKIYGKVVKELVLLTGFGMFVGFLLALFIIFLLNRFVYTGTGLQLYYFHFWSIASFLICNACILVPSILLRIRMVKKIGKEALDI